MDSSLMNFFFGTPGRSVPPPWERVYDIKMKMIYYKNGVSEAVVADLRSRVNLGGGLYHESTLWCQITGSSVEHSRYCLIMTRHDQDHPFVIQVDCCCSPSTYLVVPEPVRSCPLCEYSNPIYYH